MDPLRAVKDQFKAFGLPPGPDVPNAERAAIMDFTRRRRMDRPANAELRDENGEDWGALLMMIPELDWEIHTRADPELICKDRELRRKAWRKFVRMFGREYGVDDSVGRRQRPDGIIVR